MKTLTLLAVCAWLICGRSATLKRLRRANYVENYRLNHFTLDKRYLFNPLGDFGDQVTRMKRDKLLHKRSEEAAGGDAGVVDDDEIFGDNAETDEDGGEMDMNEYSGEPASCYMPDSERIPCGHQLNTSREYCEGLGCCYNPTRAGSFATTGTELPACFHHSVATTFFKRDVFVSTDSQRWCIPSENTKLYVGKFDKPEQADMLCHHTDTGIIDVAGGITETGYRDPMTTWTSSFSYCKPPATLHTGDTRNTYAEDLICTNSTGSISTRLSDTQNQEGYISTGWEDTRLMFCSQGGKIFVGDFDGDRWEDMLCIKGTTDDDGRFLAKADGTGKFRAPMRDPNYDEFCRDSAESYIRVGDFDGDLRMDLACIPQPGYIHLALTNGDGFLVNRDFALPDEDRWCEDGEVYTGDFNGDHRWDLLCYVQSTGKICVRFNSNIFGSAHMFFQRYCEEEPFCVGGSLYIADFNADAMDDIYCHAADGSTEVAEATIRSPRVVFISVDYMWTRTTMCWTRTRTTDDSTPMFGDEFVKHMDYW